MIERDEKKIRSVFKRIETDAEFRARLLAAGAGDRAGFTYAGYGENLDAWAWGAMRMQRRIIEDVA